MNNYVAVNLDYIEQSGDLVSGFLLSQLCQLSRILERVVKDGRTWMPIKRADSYELFYISPKQFDRAARILERGAFIFTKIYKDADGSTVKHISLNSEGWDEGIGEKIRPEKNKTSLYDRSTNLYLMLDESNGAIKIGVSCQPRYRERTLQSEKPTIALIWRTKATYGDEKFLHEYFAGKRLRGEWFDLNEEDVAYIKSEAWKGGVK